MSRGYAKSSFVGADPGPGVWRERSGNREGICRVLGLSGRWIGCGVRGAGGAAIGTGGSSVSGGERSSARGRFPVGLLGMVALTVGIEGAVARHALDLTDPASWSWVLSGRAA